MSLNPDLSTSLPTGLTRCLVVGRIEEVPKELVERIRAARGTIEAVPHPLIAFAEALRHEVADRLRPSFGLARQESIAVLFAGERFATHLESFAAAIRAHAPEVGVWTIDGNAARRLELDRSDGRPAPDPTRAPTLRLAGTEPEATPPAAPGETPDPEPRPPLDSSVTPEEIEMLLSFFDAEAGENPDGGTGTRR